MICFYNVCIDTEGYNKMRAEFIKGKITYIIYKIVKLSLYWKRFQNYRIVRMTLAVNKNYGFHQSFKYVTEIESI